MGGLNLHNVLDAPLKEAQLNEQSDHGWLVTVYDNEVNTYEQVMMILILATGCTEQEAYIETWEIDNLGSSVVHHSSEEECRSVAEIIRTIGIRVEVSPQE